jgi:hypothetical protein
MATNQWRTLGDTDIICCGLKVVQIVKCIYDNLGEFICEISSRSLSRKIDMLVRGEAGGGRMDVAPSSLAGDLSQIRATENNILNQLSDLK